MTVSVRPWVVISDYPSWPSPYFAQLADHAPPELSLCFRPTLPTVLTRDLRAGVVNLHRLKRLYRDPVTARAFADQLDRLAQRGWKLAWTVHNLLPINGEPPSAVDHQVVQEVLTRVAVVITHTQADPGRRSSHAPAHQRPGRRRRLGQPAGHTRCRGADGGRLSRADAPLGQRVVPGQHHRLQGPAESGPIVE